MLGLLQLDLQGLGGGAVGLCHMDLVAALAQAAKSEGTLLVSGHRVR